LPCILATVKFNIWIFFFFLKTNIPTCYKACVNVAATNIVYIN